METQHKRRTYYIKNSAQSKFIFRFVMLSILGGIIALASFNYLAYKKIDVILYSMRLPKISPGGLLWGEMFYTNLFVIVFTLIAFIFTAKGLFNKIHGPLKKMTNDINRMADGELNFPVSLRQKDEFRDLADELSRMAVSLNQRLSQIQDQTDSLIVHAEAAQQNPNDQAAVTGLQQTIVALRKATEAFTL